MNPKVAKKLRVLIGNEVEKLNLVQKRWNKQKEQFGETTVCRVSVVNGIAKFTGRMNGEPIYAVAEGATNKEALAKLWGKVAK